MMGTEFLKINAEIPEKIEVDHEEEILRIPKHPQLAKFGWVSAKKTTKKQSGTNTAFKNQISTKCRKTFIFYKLQ